MSPFWATLFQQLKDSGRDATLFIIALAGFFIVLVIAAVIFGTGLYRYIVPALPFIALLVLVRTCFSIRRAWRNRRHRLQYPPLSADELRKARTKLTRDSQ